MINIPSMPILWNSIYVRFSIAVFLNSILVVTQVFYAHHAHSVSLLSDAIHNLGDVIGLLIACFAQVVTYSTCYPARYTYGYQKSTFLAAFVNAILLLFSVGFITYEAMNKVLHGSTMDELQVLVVAILGVVINGLSALLFIKEKGNNINIKAAFLHLTLDALTSFGVVASALIIYYGKYQWVDSLMAFVIAGVILFNALKLLRSATKALLGVVPESIDLDLVKNYLLTIPKVTAVEQLHIWALSAEKIALTAHLLTQSNQPSIDYAKVQHELAKQFGITDITLQSVYQATP